MARPATGQVVRKRTKHGERWALRFHAYGRRQYVTLEGDDWTRPRAEDELANVLADVRRGLWRPAPTGPAAQEEELATDPTFHAFASAWIERIGPELRPKTVVDYTWQLSNHLLPFFAQHRLSGITVEEVDRYRAKKARESAQHAAARDAWRLAIDEEMDPARRVGLQRSRPPAPLSATSINKTITRLAQILEDAVEYGYLDRNPARGKRRRLKASKPAPVWLDRAEQIAAILAAAAELDREARADRKHIARQAMLSTLVFAGPRLGELLALRWSDVDLAGSRVRIRESKTDAGVRSIDLLPTLHDDLAAYKAERHRAGLASPRQLVFATSTGKPLSQDNFRHRVFEPAVNRANDHLIKVDEVPLPEGLTPHKLRHTFASLLVALNVDAGAVMDQLGHTDPAFTLRVYRHAMRRTPEAKAALLALAGLPATAPLAESAAGLGTSAFSFGASPAQPHRG